MKAIFLRAMLLWCGLLPPLVGAQSSHEPFPLAGDWDGVLAAQGSVHHVAFHMSTTPEGKMTVLMDDNDLKITGIPPIGGSFDGSHLMLRFTYWKPNSSGDYEAKVATYEATVNASNSEMSGVWTQEGTFPLNLKRVTWEAKVPKPAPPTAFDGDWTGVEYEARGITIHFFLHIRNTEDGLMVLLDCPDEKFKGALASKVAYDEATRAISITIGQSIFAGKMSADGKALETSMTEPGFHFLIHFDRLEPKKTEPN
jgi:hypothetical protein